MQQLIAGGEVGGGCRALLEGSRDDSRPRTSAVSPAPRVEDEGGVGPDRSRELAIDRNFRFEPDRYTNLAFPVMLLPGGDSPAMFQRAVEAVDEALPSAEVVVLPGQQHISMDNDPNLFHENEIGFLAR